MIKKETYIFTGAISALVILAYSLLFFLLPYPVKDNYGHILNYSLTLFLSVVFVCSFLYGLHKRKDVEGLVLRMPLIKLTIVFIVVDFVLSIVECVINAFWAMPFYIPLIVAIFELIIFFFLFLFKKQNVNHIENTEDFLKEATHDMKFFREESQKILNKCKDDVSKKNMTTVVEKFRYSDPIATEKCKEIDEKIYSSLTKLNSILDNGGSITSVDEIIQLINERNLSVLNNK